MLCDVVWCGVVWCGVVWCGVVCDLTAGTMLDPLLRNVDDKGQVRTAYLSGWTPEVRRIVASHWSVEL